jgi:ABC-type sugar transport system substrate-binding protein
MENYLTTYGDEINLLYGLSDGVTYPAAQVIINDGRADQILICSIDGASDAIQAIIDGDMDCTYMLASQYTGYYKVLIPYEVMTGAYVFAPRAITSCPASSLPRTSGRRDAADGQRHGKQHRHLPV